MDTKFGNYMRGKRSPNKKAPTKKKRMENQRFGLVMHCLWPLREYLTAGFVEESAARSAFDSAKSYNMRNGVKATKSGYELDYGNLMLSRGSLKKAADMKASMEDGNMVYSWSYDSDDISTAATDKAMPFAWNGTTGSTAYSLNAAARGDGRAVLRIPPSWALDTIHIYMAFASVDGQCSSDSQYLGEMKL
jgi:hypothetical protein